MGCVTIEGFHLTISFINIINVLHAICNSNKSTWLVGFCIAILDINCMHICSRLTGYLEKICRHGSRNLMVIYLIIYNKVVINEFHLHSCISQLLTIFHNNGLQLSSNFITSSGSWLDDKVQWTLGILFTSKGLNMPKYDRLISRVWEPYHHCFSTILWCGPIQCAIIIRIGSSISIIVWKKMHTKFHTVHLQFLALLMFPIHL